MEEDIKEILTALDNTTKKQLDEAIANADKEWSEMELEEDIKILEELVERYKEYIVEDYPEMFVDISIDKRDIQAIEHLIARNKELEEAMNFVQPFVSLTNRMVNKILEDNDYIPKSKVREKIEELEKDKENEKEDEWLHCSSVNNLKITVLQELLED